MSNSNSLGLMALMDKKYTRPNNATYSGGYILPY